MGKLNVYRYFFCFLVIVHSFFLLFYSLIMKTSKQLTPRKKAAVLELRKVGLSHRKIARQLNFSNTAISNFINRVELTSDLNRKVGTGKGNRKSTEDDDDVLEQLSLQDRFRTANELRADWRKSTGVDVSKHTVNRRLLLLDLPAMKPRRKPLLGEAQCQRRLAFATRYHHWNLREWKRVIFSDETWMELFSHQGKQYVRRRQGEEFQPECMVKTIKHPAKVMCWGGITPDGTTSLIWIDGNCNAAKYIETLGKAKIANFVRKHPHPRPLLMEDGAPCHRARMMQNWHAERGIKILEGWPGNSPDLNPIENVWGLMKKEISRENPTNLDEIKKICLRVWKRLTPEYLTSLFASMPRRMQLCIEANGGSTKY